MSDFFLNLRRYVLRGYSLCRREFTSSKKISDTPLTQTLFATNAIETHNLGFFNNFLNKRKKIIFDRCCFNLLYVFQLKIVFVFPNLGDGRHFGVAEVLEDRRNTRVVARPLLPYHGWPRRISGNFAFTFTFTFTFEGKLLSF